MRTVLYGVLGVIATASSFPYVAHWWVSTGGGLSEKDGNLSAAQVRRGAFTNSGSRDVGKDPQWDFRTGQYKQPTGYATIEKAPPQVMAMPVSEQQEKKLEEFAKGRRSIDGDRTR